MTHKSLSVQNMYACHDVQGFEREVSTKNKKAWLDIEAFTVRYDDLREHVYQVITSQEVAYGYDSN